MSEGNEQATAFTARRMTNKGKKKNVTYATNKI